MVELAALEKRYGATHRGFESLPLRQVKYLTFRWGILLGTPSVISAFSLLCSFAKENAYSAFFCFTHYAEQHDYGIFLRKIPVVCANHAETNHRKKASKLTFSLWYTRRDSNTRPSAPQADALSS